MKQTSIRWNVVLAIIYIVVFSSSVYFMLEIADDGFGCIPAIMLTLPWSALMLQILQAIVPVSFTSEVIVTIILILGACINTLLLVYGLSWTKVLFKKKLKN
jgi:hypothetical protein